MKTMKTSIQRLTVLTSLVLMVSCGLQVRSNPAVITTPNPNTGGEDTLYKVSGVATGIKYAPLDIPTGYAINMPEGIRLTINGEEFAVNQNGVFTVPEEFKSGDDYLVEIADNGIVIPHEDGVSSSIYLNCDLSNVSGTIVDSNVDDVRVDCFLSDTQYKDPWELP